MQIRNCFLVLGFGGHIVCGSTADRHSSRQHDRKDVLTERLYIDDCNGTCPSSTGNLLTTDSAPYLTSGSFSTSIQTAWYTSTATFTNILTTTVYLSNAASSSSAIPAISILSSTTIASTVAASVVPIPASSAVSSMYTASIMGSNSTCSNDTYNAVNYTSMPTYFGLNVVNTKPNTNGSVSSYRTAADWDEAFSRIRQNFNQTNAVRMYAVMDSDSEAGHEVNHTHLLNALPAAAKHGFSILAGVWSGGPTSIPRFETEIAGLQQVLDKNGCQNIAAVSVGNEDLNELNEQTSLSDADRLAGKMATTNLLVEQIGRVRTLLRQKGCCNVPVTHTDTWNNLNDTSQVWVSKLIQNCDQAIIANIFPWWSGSDVQDSWSSFVAGASLTKTAANLFGKDLWLGETGWPVVDAQHRAFVSIANAQTYYKQFGCQIMAGNGTAFYYVDWDEDKTNNAEQPSFGLLRANGSTVFDVSCQGYKPDTRAVDTSLPGWLGGTAV